MTGDNILVIEDDTSYLRYLTYVLGKEGYQVSSAIDGLLGLQKAKEENPALLILDVMLPGMDGFEVCHNLRKEASTAKIPIIILSAKGQDADKATALKVGASVFYTKPVDRELLLSKIKELLLA